MSGLPGGRPEGGPLGGPDGGPEGGPDGGPLGGPDGGPLGGPDGGPLGGPDGGPEGDPDGGPLGGPEGGPLGVSFVTGSDSTTVSVGPSTSSVGMVSSEAGSSVARFSTTSVGVVCSGCDSAIGSSTVGVSGTSISCSPPNAPPNISSAAAFFSSSLDFSADVFGPATSSPHLGHRARLKYALSHGGLLPAWCSGLS